MMALHSRSVGMVSDYSGWLCSNSSSTSPCVIIQNPADVFSPTHPRSPVDLLMVLVVIGTHTVSVTDR